jgi:hypothetical protein
MSAIVLMRWVHMPPPGLKRRDRSVPPAQNEHGNTDPHGFEDESRTRALGDDDDEVSREG